MSRLTASDFMRTEYVSIPDNMPVGEATDHLLYTTRRETDSPDIAVIVDAMGDFVGLFTLISALGALLPGSAFSESDPVSDHVVFEPPSLSPTDPLSGVLSAVTSSKGDASPVFDGDLLVGVVFLCDVFDRIAEESLVDSAFDPED